MNDLGGSKTPGRRKRSGKAAATRRALADAALATFLDVGFTATRMSDVAERAGLAKGTVYLHFRDKAALFEAVLRDLMHDTLDRHPVPRPRRDETTPDFLRRAVLPALRELQDGDRFGVIRLVMAEGQRLPDLAQVYRTVTIAPMMRLVRLYARRAERRGELRSDALTRFPMLLAAPVVLSVLWNGLFGQAEPLDVATVFASYLDLVFGREGEPAANRSA